jgi:zinc D-Ala-D-Ala carboxypeptidase
MISEHISYKEGVYSITATRRGIDNTPDDEQLINMKLIAEKIFEPLREWVSGPIKINSFFRSIKLNKAIGGSRKSQHCQGQAMDIDDTFKVVANSDMYEYIKNNLDFDQLIWEFGNDDNPNWLHVSYVSPEKNRNRCLKAYKEQGRSKYMII